MKKALIFFLMLSALWTQVKAAEGIIAYETATSSIQVKTVELSTSAATLVSPTKAQSLRTDGKFVVWYSMTLFNVTSSTGAYAFGSSETVAPPEATCDLGAPIGSGTTSAPWSVTEAFQGMYLWAISCDDTAANIRRLSRGR